jgi:hypothetical protein
MEDDARWRLTRYLEFYNPSRLKNVDSILQSYHRDLDALFQDLQAQYGPEPFVDEHGNLVTKPRALQPSWNSSAWDTSVSPEAKWTPSRSREMASSSPGRPHEPYVTRQVKLVSSGLYVGNFSQASQRTRELVELAAQNAAQHQRFNGPASVDEVAWWGSDAGKPIQTSGEVSARAFQRGSHSNAGYSPSQDSPFSRHPPPMRSDRLESHPRADGASPAPSLNRYSRPMPDYHANELIDVICVKCGKLGKMNRMGEMVSGQCMDSHAESDTAGQTVANTPVRPLPPTGPSETPNTITVEHFSPAPYKPPPSHRPPPPVAADPLEKPSTVPGGPPKPVAEVVFEADSDGSPTATESTNNTAPATAAPPTSAVKPEEKPQQPQPDPPTQQGKLDAAPAAPQASQESSPKPGVVITEEKIAIREAQKDSDDL